MNEKTRRTNEAKAEARTLFQLSKVDPSADSADVEMVTVVHELGFQFGLAYKPGTIMKQGALHPSLKFDDEQILFLRTDDSKISN